MISKLIILLISLFILSSAYIDYKIQSEADYLIKTKCTVINNRIRHIVTEGKISKSPDIEYKPGITYKYKVNGKVYVSNKYYFNDKISFLKKDIEIIQKKYKKNREYNCFYNKNNPHFSVLNKDKDYKSIIIKLIIIIFLLLVIIFYKSNECKKITIENKLHLNKKYIISIFFILILSVILFVNSVYLRKSSFGVITEKNHHWLTCSTIIFTSNWYNEGPYKLNFAMLENPYSVEFDTFTSRRPYISYPIGCILPIYTISKFLSICPSPKIVMGYNLMNHFIVSLFLGLIVFNILLMIGISYFNSIIFSIIPIILELFLPGNLYYFQNIYFSDIAVILPFVLTVFFETLRFKFKSRVLNSILYALFFIGIFTDWLFVFVVFIIFLKRIFLGEFNKNVFKKIIEFWLAPFLSIFIFIIHTSIISNPIKLINTFFFRSGTFNVHSRLFNKFYEYFWNRHILESFGFAGKWIIFIVVFIAILGFIIERLKKHVPDKIRLLIYSIILTVIPQFIHLFVFKNHSTIHNFSSLKFGITIAVSGFVLVPVLLIECITLKSTYKKNKIYFVIGVLILINAIIYTNENINNYQKFLYPKPQKMHNICSYIKNNKQFNDVIYSPDYQIRAIPPIKLSLSMKRIYKVKSYSRIIAKSKNIKSKHRDILFFANKPNKYWNLVIRKYKLKRIWGDEFYTFQLHN